MIDDSARLFFRDVALGRSLSYEQLEAVTTGQVWLAAEAQTLGLIDAVESAAVEDRMPNTPTPEPTPPDQTATLQEAVEKQTALLEAAMKRIDTLEAEKQALEAEKERAKYVAEAETFAHVPGVATDRLGAMLQAFDGTEYADDLRSMCAATSKLVAQSPRLQGRGGLSIIPQDEGIDAVRAKAKQLASERGISMSAALAAVATENPELYGSAREDPREAAQ